MLLRLRRLFARRVALFGLGAALLAALIAGGASSIFAQRATHTSSQKSPQVIHGGVTHGATKSGVGGVPATKP